MVRQLDYFTELLFCFNQASPEIMQTKQGESTQLNCLSLFPFIFVCYIALISILYL